MAQSDPKIIQDEKEFMDDLVAFHEQRGTTLDREPKAAGHAISLHQLYQMVMERGGYDQLSRERMQWRTLVKSLGANKQQEAAMAFPVKTAYYKNLAAYEIAKYWNETPPPREILEDLTAKGGEIRSRTLDNFLSSGAPESNTVVESNEVVDDEQTTPKADKMEVEEPGSASRYPSRNLRQDPKRTQIFQPDTLPARSRNIHSTSSPQYSPAPQPAYQNASSDPRNPSFSIDKYEPRQPISLTLRPVLTPGSNPDMFYQRKAVEKAQAMPRVQPEPQQFLRGAIPNMGGPNIYLRCLYGLRSGIEEEQNFALHHLVKVSYERGDKYKFEGFPLLAESLLEKALEILPLVYDTKWDISYDEEEGGCPENTINGAFGTPDLLQRIRALKLKMYTPDLTADILLSKLEKLNEAALVIRNMVILEENAIFLSRFALFRDFLTIAINLPDQPRLTEFRHYALEMAEQVTRYWAMLPNDPLYLSMLPYLESNDRGLMLSALRAINRIGIETLDTHRITGVPFSAVERLVSLLLLESDDELLEASLDFLYEFTAIPENNTFTLSQKPDLYASIMPRLTTLLLHNAISGEEKILNRPVPQPPQIPPTIPSIPADLYQQLLQFPEPDRSSRWLRCCFEESPQDDITQIAIWQAYQGRFQQNNPIPAADFIKNVSNTFSSAQAQVINGPQPRFIIKGIRPRRILLDTQGRAYFKCFWENVRNDSHDSSFRHNQRHLCNQWQSNRQNIWLHIMQDHLGIPRNAEGRFTNDAVGQYQCRWSGCLRSSPFTKPIDISNHLRSHIPETSEAMSKLILELSGAGKAKEPEYTTHTYYLTATDTTRHACGIPFMSVMIMRNLARFANKDGRQYDRSNMKLMDQFFGGVLSELWHVISVNRTLRDWLGDLISIIEKGERDAKRGLKRDHEEEDLDSVPISGM